MLKLIILIRHALNVSLVIGILFIIIAILVIIHELMHLILGKAVFLKST